MPCTVLLCECIWIVLEQNSIFLHIVWSWVSNMFNSFSFHYFTCCANVLESMECKRLNGILKCTHTKSKLLFLELQWLPWLHEKQMWINVSCLSLFTIKFEHTYLEHASVTTSARKNPSLYLKLTCIGINQYLNTAYGLKQLLYLCVIICRQI